VGWEKVTCWSTKAAISLKRVKIEKTLPWRAYRKSQQFFRTVPSPTPYGLPFPRLGVRNPTPKLQSLLSHERVKLRTANLDDTFTGSIRTQVHETFWRKGSVGVSRDGPNFFEYPITPYYLRNGYSYELQTWQMYSQCPCAQKPLKIGEKIERGRIQGLPKKFSVPLLSQERAKLRTSSFVRTFLVSIGMKAHYKFREN